MASPLAGAERPRSDTDYRLGSARNRGDCPGYALRPYRRPRLQDPSPPHGAPRVSQSSGYL
ncbi:MAG: hypothetical protein GY820_00350 [Gammaproteobacteria bacterium]|nr:hypothetical protein [Gammaproteobacteria bacterium]